MTKDEGQNNVMSCMEVDEFWVELIAKDPWNVPNCTWQGHIHVPVRWRSATLRLILGYAQCSISQQGIRYYASYNVLPQHLTIEPYFSDQDSHNL